MDREQTQALGILNHCLDLLYRDDRELFEDGVRCERCLVFRFSHHLQNYLPQVNLPDHFVDCDYDASSGPNGTRRCAKPIISADGTKTDRYVDVIVHRRKIDNEDRNGFFCIEFKKWNNYKRKNRELDEQKLKELTSSYGYRIGFLVILGRSRDRASIKTFIEGRAQ